MDTAYHAMRGFRDGTYSLPKAFFSESEESQESDYRQPSELDSLFESGLVHRTTTVREMRRIMRKNF